MTAAETCLCMHAARRVAWELSPSHSNCKYLRIILIYMFSLPSPLLLPPLLPLSPLASFSYANSLIRDLLASRQFEPIKG